MKILTVSEAASWAHLHGHVVLGDGLSFGNDWALSRLKLEKYNLSILDQSRELVADVLSSECLLWVFEWGIFNDRENFWIFSRIRESLGENRPVGEAPAFLFSPEESEEASSLVSMVISFGWDAFLVSGESRKAYILRGHEGHVEALKKSE